MHASPKFFLTWTNINEGFFIGVRTACCFSARTGPEDEAALLEPPLAIHILKAKGLHLPSAV